jgi:hypothetical protein
MAPSEDNIKVASAEDKYHQPEDTTMHDVSQDTLQIQDDSNKNQPMDKPPTTAGLAHATDSPDSWGPFDDDDDVDPFPPLPPSNNSQTWKTTPSRSPKKSQKPLLKPGTSPPISRPTKSSRDKATNLFRQAFPPTNRFSVLTEEIITQPTDISMTSLSNASPNVSQDNISLQESAYEDSESSDDPSFDDMSIVSNAEIQDLVNDQSESDNDNGYDTETTNNTSPSVKSIKPTRRIASKNASAQITEMYESTRTHLSNPWDCADLDSKSLSAQYDSSHTVPSTDPDHLFNASPHPSRNTTTHREGLGAGKS